MTEYLNQLIKPYKYVLAAVIICLSGIIIFINLPAEDEYYRNADEGNYYRQGKLLADYGFAGFKMITDIYTHTPALQDAPNPFRIGANMSSGVVLAVHDSFRSISLFSLLNFILLLAGTFFFADRYWGAVTALCTLILMAFSPLEMAMARRALMDMPAMTGIAFTCFAFWIWAGTGSWKYMWAFVGLMVWTVLMKEVNVIFLPFFALMFFYLKWQKQLKCSLPQITLGLILPALIIGLIYIAIFGYQDGVVLFQTMRTAVSNSSYSAVYGQGPWYRLLLDYTMLSPFVMILAMMFAGRYFSCGKSTRNTDFILLLALFMIISFSFLPKNVRYAIFFDLPLRLLAANGLIFLMDQKFIRKLQWLPALIILFLVMTDLHSFYDYFIDHAIYDPVSYKLLMVNHIIPGLKP